MSIFKKTQNANEILTEQEKNEKVKEILTTEILKTWKFTGDVKDRLKKHYDYLQKALDEPQNENFLHGLTKQEKLDLFDTSTLTGLKNRKEKLQQVISLLEEISKEDNV